MPQLYLASTSPRRLELLRQVGLEPQQVKVAVDETPAEAETPELFVRRMAETKASAARTQIRDGLIVAADTVGVLDGSILGKPRDRDHGIEMLRSLSGRLHQVLTAVAVEHAGRCSTRLSVSNVHFRPISAAECAAYWATGECQDKAGAYAIQGRAAMFVARLDGSYSGVMGLPLFETVELLRAEGVTIWE